MRNRKTPLIPKKSLTRKEFARVVRSITAQVVRRKDQRIGCLELTISRNVFPTYNLGGKIEPIPLPTKVSLEFLVVRKFRKYRR